MEVPVKLLNFPVGDQIMQGNGLLAVIVLKSGITTIALEAKNSKSFNNGNIDRWHLPSIGLILYLHEKNYLYKLCFYFFCQLFL